MPSRRLIPSSKPSHKIIDSLLDDIRELEQQQQALHTALEGNMQTLRESLMSPAQLLLARKQEYTTLMGQFEGGDEATQDCPCSAHRGTQYGYP